MRKALIVGLALSLGLAFGAPAAADPTRGASASAFALEATGLVPISRTPVVNASAPPDSGLRRAILEVPAQPLVTSATGAAEAEARVLQTIQAKMDGVLDGVNARGYAIIEDLNVLVSGTAAPAVLSVALIEAEAVAQCVGKTPIFDTGSQFADVRLNGEPVKLVNDVLNIPVDLLNPTGPLAAVISFSKNETGTLPGGNGVFVDGLVIRILSGVIGEQQTQTIRLAHAEARMENPCDPVAAPRNPPDLGAADLGPGAGAPLPRTGSNEMVAVPLALGMLVTAVVLRQVNRRARRATA